MNQQRAKPSATIKSVTPIADVSLKLNRYVFHVDRFVGAGRDVTWDVMERGNSVGVLGYDPQRDEVVLINEFRPGALASGDSPFFDSLVAGTVGKGETSVTAAIREMKEEGGLDLQDPIVVHSGAYVSAGGTSEKVAIVFGIVDTSKAGGIHGKRSEDEDIKAVVQSTAEYLRRVRSGEIVDMKTIVAGYWFAEYKQRNASNSVACGS
jgi:ADP-ribose pyrophosphatase